MALRRLFSASLWLVFFCTAVKRGFELLLDLFLEPDCFGISSLFDSWPDDSGEDAASTSSDIMSWDMVRNC